MADELVIEQDSTVIKSIDCLKHKLTNILCSELFCGICLEGDDNLNMIDDIICVNTNYWSHNVSLKEIFDSVFNCTNDIIASFYVCIKCTDKLVQSYIFINNTKVTTKLVKGYIDDLMSKSVDVTNHLDKSPKLDSSNIVIILQNTEIDKYLARKSVEKNIESRNINGKENKQRRHTQITKKAISRGYKCRHCEVILPTYQAYWKHMQYHKKKKVLQCIICYKTFKTQQYLSAHYKVHSKVKCKLCYAIISDTELIDHLKDKHETCMHLCKLCNIAYYSSNSLKTHAKICHSVEDIQNRPTCIMCLKNFKEDEMKFHNCKYKCPECSEMPCVHYKYLMSYREQILNHASGAKCLDCDYVCRKREILLGHVNREHLNHRPYTCDKCAQQFYSKPSLKAHIHRCHQENFICEFCDCHFNSKSAYANHTECCSFVKRKLICGKCPASFDTPEDLGGHEKRRHSVMYPCGLCYKIFFKESKRKEHMFKVHSGLQPRNSRLNVQCVVCEDNFDTKCELVEHMKTHGPKYPCRICNKEYETIRKLRAHNRKHIGPFTTCHICGKELKLVFLERHLKNHDSDGIATCETCGKSFPNIALLKYHQKDHLAKVPCPKCNKLINPARMRRHWRSHTSGNTYKQKPNFKCESCNYKTWNSMLLECHMNRHHLKVKPYVCHICSKDFIGKHLLRKHIETHTVKTVQCAICSKWFANSACLKMHFRLHTGEKNYACDICGERFRSSSIMNVHKLKKHSDKHNACPLCSSKFHTIRDLRRHVIKVHWKQKKRFNPRELKGLSEEHYHLFHDGRRVRVTEDVEFYMPC